MLHLERIKKLAMRSGLLMQEVADLMKISRPGLYLMIKRNSAPLPQLEKLAKILNCELSEFYDIESTQSEVSEKSAAYTRPEDYKNESEMLFELYKKSEEMRIKLSEIEQSLQDATKCK